MAHNTGGEYYGNPSLLGKGCLCSIMLSFAVNIVLIFVKKTRVNLYVIMMDMFMIYWLLKLTIANTSLIRYVNMTSQ